MQLATQLDGINALSQLATDLSNTADQLGAAAQGNVQKAQSTYFPLGSALVGGTTDAINAATSTIETITQAEQTLLGAMTAYDDPSTPLSPTELASLKDLQQSVIDARSSVGSIISNVDWTYGGIFDDTVTAIENDASQGLTNLKHALTPSWYHWILIGVGIVLVLLLWKEL